MSYTLVCSDEASQLALINLEIGQVIRRKDIDTDFVNITGRNDSMNDWVVYNEVGEQPQFSRSVLYALCHRLDALEKANDELTEKCIKLKDATQMASLGFPIMDFS